MSRETMEDLNTNTLIGFTEKRGQAWHYREGLQGAEPNHYPGAIPVEDVTRRLFSWDLLEGDITVTVKLPDGKTVDLPGTSWKGLVRPDTMTILDIPGHGYTVHDFKPWLLDRVATILDDDLKIGSAGLLRDGKMAWVQVETDETHTVEGFQYRPFLTASSSHDGMISNRLQRNVQAVVCDNTLAAARGEKGQTFAIRHTRNSTATAKVAAAREALGLVMGAGDDFAEEVRKLTSEKVSDRRFQKWAEAAADLAKAQAAAKDGSKRTLTTAETKVGELVTLWKSDERVHPWHGTAFGVLQAWNTWTHHFQGTRGQSRSDANALRVARGYVGQVDEFALSTLARV